MLTGGERKPRNEELQNLFGKCDGNDMYIVQIYEKCIHFNWKLTMEITWKILDVDGRILLK
jgi:hypothetical protein